MKILHLDSGREMRGGQWQVLRLHQRLVETGHESFLMARQESPLLLMARERGLPCEAMGDLRLAMGSRAFEVVHAHDAHSHTLAAVFSRSPLVVSRRVAFPIRKSLASRWKYRRARRYLAVSRHVGAILVAAGIDAARIDIVYDGVELPAVCASGDTILTPYTLDTEKGMDLAEKAAALAGIHLIRSTNLEADLPTARAMIYLTQSEGLGSGILLAMAHGVPVIATQTGGIPELIDDGINGILVQNEAESVVAGLRRVCAELGQAARETVRERFSVAHMVSASLESYQKALND